MKPFRWSSPDKNELLKQAQGISFEDKRVNIRLSSTDLLDIQAKALAEGMPQQTRTASVLHKYAAGRLAEKEPAAAGAELRPIPRST